MKSYRRRSSKLYWTENKPIFFFSRTSLFYKSIIAPHYIWVLEGSAWCAYMASPKLNILFVIVENILPYILQHSYCMQNIITKTFQPTNHLNCYETIIFDKNPWLQETTIKIIKFQLTHISKNNHKANLSLLQKDGKKTLLQNSTKSLNHKNCKPCNITTFTYHVMMVWWNRIKETCYWNMNLILWFSFYSAIHLQIHKNIKRQIKRSFTTS